jgi:hypothetical protein
MLSLGRDDERSVVKVCTLTIESWRNWEWELSLSKFALLYLGERHAQADGNKSACRSSLVLGEHVLPQYPTVPEIRAGLDSMHSKGGLFSNMNKSKR